MKSEERIKTENSNQTVIDNQIEKQSNVLGTAGFVLSLILFFVAWIPVLYLLILFLALIFSFIGLFGKPKGLAIAGFIISLFNIMFVVIGFLNFKNICNGTMYF